MPKWDAPKWCSSKLDLFADFQPKFDPIRFAGEFSLIRLPHEKLAQSSPVFDAVNAVNDDSLGLSRKRLAQAIPAHLSSLLA